MTTDIPQLDGVHHLILSHRSITRPCDPNDLARLSLRDSVPQLFRPGRAWHIGVEVELIPSFADGLPVPPQVLAALFDRRFKAAARPSSSRADSWS
jgi:hypothetical protein